MLQKDCDHAILLFALQKSITVVALCMVIIHKSLNWQYFSLIPKVNSPLKYDIFS